MHLHTLQQMIQSVYELETAYRVDDFLIMDRQFADCYGSSHQPLEQLIFRQNKNHTEVSLYLDRQIVRALNEFEVNKISLNMLCMAVEGVSHFVHFCWRMEKNFSLSLLELELQAEVDKYVLISDLVGYEGLRQSLFEKFSLHPGMSAECSERYRSANRLAAKYCSNLERRYLRKNKIAEMLNELRRFCRHSQGQKIRTIEHH